MKLLPFSFALGAAVTFVTVSALDNTTSYDYFDEETETYYYKKDRTLGTTRYKPYNSFISQPYVANGYIGARIPNLGFGFTYDQNENTSSSLLDNGWPLFNKRFSGAFIAGFFDAQPNTTGTNFPELLDDGGYESVISVAPQWTDFYIGVTVNNTEYVLDPQKTNETDFGSIENYYQELDMSDGLVITYYTWLNLIDVKVTVGAHRNISSLGFLNFELSTNSSDAVNITIKDYIDFTTAQRCGLNSSGFKDDGIFMTFYPTGVDYKFASIYSYLDVEADGEMVYSSNETYTEISTSVLLHSNSTTSVTKFVGIASDDMIYSNSSSTTLDIAQQVALEATDLEEALTSHDDAWSNLWSDTRVDISNDAYLTLAAEASIYHLLTNTRATATNLTSALSVGGLSSDSYAGMVFWDMDLWMLPALLPVAPDNAVAISKYRYYIHDQAKINAEENGYNGSVYSWTSGRFGNCTGTGPCVNYEYHLNVAICYSIWKLYLTGAIDDDYLEDYGWPILKDTADFFADYVEFNDTLGKYTTHNLTDPDEYANFKNNAAYTSVGISQVMKWTTLVAEQLGLSSSDKWSDIMENMYLPVSPDNITLEYDTMNSSVSIKQADVVLISYLDEQDGSLVDYFDYDKDRAYDDLIYYSEHQSSQGPAMTFPVFVAVSQKLNDIGCGSQTYLHKSVDPFLRLPFGQMSEQNNDDFDVNGGTHPAFPFQTGHGGLVQSYYFGLTGLRFSYNMSSNGTINRILHFDPVQLPLLDGDLTISGFQYMNTSLEITIGTVNATISNNGTDGSINLYVDSRNELSGYYTLGAGEILTVPVYLTDFNMEGSLTECKSFAYSLTSGMDGDVLDSLIDGDNSTKWQAVNKTVPAQVVIDLLTTETFDSGMIYWGVRPAANFSISVIPDIGFIANAFLTPEYFTTEYFNITSVLSDYDVDISSKYNATDVEVKITDLNYTSFDLNSSYEARYVLLELIGVLDDDEDDAGAQIAEFALFNSNA
ncbi:glycoside hydrolase family 65 protein [[Candida] arabinofermentans NRRL YB-2248]|uniref:alpha,alpha-trehalase n=1 Tax=[Candida] arabinofermentans NRRL YB-2248 TaxID=983967 RepID=A0A1E4T474_9ASCO|nr:glycoside hydrolase family 65 protein [[Candida] arabinofermentans NRRL YB-2248]